LKGSPADGNRESPLAELDDLEEIRNFSWLGSCIGVSLDPSPETQKQKTSARVYWKPPGVLLEGTFYRLPEQCTDLDERDVRSLDLGGQLFQGTLDQVESQHLPPSVDLSSKGAAQSIGMSPETRSSIVSCLKVVEEKVDSTMQSKREEEERSLLAARSDISVYDYTSLGGYGGRGYGGYPGYPGYEGYPGSSSGFSH
jgi:hypothetical protein